MNKEEFIKECEKRFIESVSRFDKDKLSGITYSIKKDINKYNKSFEKFFDKYNGNIDKVPFEFLVSNGLGLVNLVE